MLRGMWFLTLLMTACFAQAHEYLCTNAAAERKISVQHEVPGQALPCVVRYDKTDEGITEYPWTATHTEGYCEEKADYLATRLETFGWSCDRTDDESVTGQEDAG